MAGGMGTRLWPLSRAGRPKQFLALEGEETMLQLSMRRVEKLQAESSVVICNEEHRFLAAEQLQEIGIQSSIILEPEGRNTAPAIALAAFLQNDESIMVVMSADHSITDEEVFCSCVEGAIPLAESGKLVTLGVVPTEPNTGYGYIKKGETFGSSFLVAGFIEKPDQNMAAEYVRSGNYLWNSGIFIFKPNRYLEELRKYRPDIYEASRIVSESAELDGDFLRVDSAAFANCPNESIDYAVMEKTSHAVVVPMDAGWRDLGSWNSLWEMAPKDASENVTVGNAVLHDVTNSYIRAEDSLVAAVGLSDMIVVSTKDALLIGNRDDLNGVSQIIQHLRDGSHSEWLAGTEVFRPWGKYNVLEAGAGFQVKKITVNPGEKLSVQYHNHRSEHWIVVGGIATVSIENKIFDLRENQSTYIPAGAVHSLENQGEEPLHLIEVQTGSYLGEDDIVRLEDRYGR